VGEDEGGDFKMSDVDDILRKLRALAENRVLLGKTLIPEDQFYIHAVNLKRWIQTSNTLRPSTMDNLEGLKSDLLSLLDELEKLVHEAKPVIGKVLIPKSQYLQHLSAIETLALQLAKDLNRQ
jgi:hypothetical protein